MKANGGRFRRAATLAAKDHLAHMSYCLDQESHPQGERHPRRQAGIAARKRALL